jgi:outer membrane immunogenic protein
MGALRTQAIAGFALLALLAQSTPASADGPVGGPVDPYRYTPYDPAPLVFSWSGFYIGANVGWAYTSAESAESIPDPDDLITAVSLNYEQTASSITGGGQVGWQRQWNTWVFGIEGAYSAISFDTNKFSPLISTVSDIPLTRSVEVSNIFTLTGRLGYAYEQWLAYIKGGWASADINASYNFGGFTTSTSGRENGWTAGIGIDYAIHPNLFVGVEYNYLSFRSDVIAPAAVAVAVPGVQTGDVSIDTQTVVLRLNYRFGHRP